MQGKVMKAYVWGLSALVVLAPTMAMAANKAENMANAGVAIVKLVVVAIVGLVVAQNVARERLSALWGVVLGAALIGGFLFRGEATFTWLWSAIQAIADGL